MPSKAVKPAVYIIDTNIVVAGLISGDSNSPPALILDGMLSGKIIYLLSADLFAENSCVLQRRKIRRLHDLSDEEVDILLTELVANAIWREPPAPAEAPDPGDDHLWALLATQAECILVTGDRLLVENPPKEHSVMSARAYVDLQLS